MFFNAIKLLLTLASLSIALLIITAKPVGLTTVIPAAFFIFLTFVLWLEYTAASNKWPKVKKAFIWLLLFIVLSIVIDYFVNDHEHHPVKGFIHIIILLLKAL